MKGWAAYSMALSGSPKNEWSVVSEQHQSVCCLMQAKAKLVQFHKPTFVTKEKCPKIRTNNVPFLEVLGSKQSKTGSAMDYVATTEIIQEMVESLHTTTAHK